MNKDYLEVPIPYFWIRGEEEQVSRIEIRNTDKDLKGLMNFLMKNPEELGTHFVVTTEGDIIQCVEPESRVKFFDIGDSNGLVGIIVAGEVSDKQIDQLITLCTDVCTEHVIPINRITFDIEGFPEFEFLNSLGASILDSLIHETAET